MKNHQGAVATLLTLGLVIVGTLITLGTSLFVNNQKNIASNPRASSQLSCGGIVSGCSINYYACGGNKYSTTSDCSNNVVGDEGPGNYCKRVCPPPSDGGGNDDAPKVGCTNMGQAYICANNCDGSCEKGTKSGIAKWCCPGGSDSGNNSEDYNNGNPIVGEKQSCCFGKKGKIYVFASYLSMVNSDMVDSNGKADCKRQSAAVQRSYQADSRGAFVCPPGVTNEMSQADYDNLVAEDQKANIPAGKLGGKCKSDQQSAFYTNYYCDSPNVCSDPKKGGTCIKSKITCTGTGYSCATLKGTAVQTCTNKSVGTTLYTSVPSLTCNPGQTCCKSSTSSCEIHFGFKCSSAGYPNSSDSFNYYKNIKADCKNSTLSGNCYGTTPNSCSTEWTAFAKSQCETGSSGGVGGGSGEGNGEAPNPSQNIPECKNYDNIQTSNEKCPPVNALFKSYTYPCLNTTLEIVCEKPPSNNSEINCKQEPCSSIQGYEKDTKNNFASVFYNNKTLYYMNVDSCNKDKDNNFKNGTNVLENITKSVCLKISTSPKQTTDQCDNAGNDRINCYGLVRAGYDCVWGNNKCTVAETSDFACAVVGTGYKCMLLLGSDKCSSNLGDGYAFHYCSNKYGVDYGCCKPHTTSSLPTNTFRSEITTAIIQNENCPVGFSPKLGCFQTPTL